MKSAFRQCAAALAVGLVGVSAKAISVDFSCTTNNSGNCATVASQIDLEVTDLGSTATFTFSNNGPLASSLTDIYWRSTALTGGSISDSGTGVSFDWGARPHNPGGGITWNAAVSADSNSPVAPNGVNPGEWVSFTFAYSGSFDDLIASLMDGVAIHLQSLAGDESEWAVSAPIPEPQSYALMLAGLGVVGFVASRRRGR